MTGKKRESGKKAEKSMGFGFAVSFPVNGNRVKIRHIVSLKDRITYSII